MATKKQRIFAAALAFAMLFCSTDFTAFSSGIGEDNATNQTICGMEEHIHTTDCYMPILTCGLEETEPETIRTFHSTFDVHRHDDSCYDAAGNLSCGMIAGEYYHTHNEYCRDEAGDLVCGLETRKPHEHTAECYQTEQILICGQEESEAHTHDETCYEIREILTCEIPTTTHHHTESCFNEKGYAICGKQEIPAFTCSEANWTDEVVSEGHRHSDECYSKQLICSRTEHVHTSKCYAQMMDDTDVVTATDLQEKPDTAPQETPNTEMLEETNANNRDEPDAADQEESGEVQQEEPKTDSPEKPTGKPIPTEEPTEQITEEPATTENTAEEPEDLVFEVDGDTLIGYHGEETTVAVPDGIRTIGLRAFAGNRQITKVILPDSVEIIKNYAFEECTNLETIEIGTESKLEIIGKGAFRNDRKLDTSFAANVKNIVENAFECDTVEESIEEESEEEPVEEEPAEEEPAEEEPAEEEPAEEEPEEEEPTEEEPTEEEPAEEEPVEEEPAEEEPVEEEPDEEEPEEEPAEEEPAEEEPAEEEPAEADTTEEELEAEAVEETAEKNSEEPEIVTILTAEDAPVQVSVSFSTDAGIPEGTELIVTEGGESSGSNEEKTGSKDEEIVSRSRAAAKSAPAMRMSRNRTAAEEEPRAEIPSLITWKVNEEEPEIILYQQTLDISLVADGEEIEPNPESVVTVSVRLPGIEAGQDIEVRHITEQGSVLLESTNDAGTVTFTTDSFSLFEFTSRAQQLSGWQSEILEGVFQGKTANQENNHTMISITDVTEGLAVLEAYAVTKSSDLWMTLRYVKDLALGRLESITLYAVEDGKLSGIVKENITAADIVRFNLGDLSNFALVLDSGLRRRTEELGNVVLSGLMPKNGVAEAIDVTEEYSGWMLSVKNGESTETSVEQGNSAGDFRTIAAYDISIINDGEEYQPDAEHPVSVTITDERIVAGENIELWHIRDDGSEEQVENLTIADGMISFDAVGFSVYTVIDHEDGTIVAPRVMFHFIADGATENTNGINAYYIGSPYSFKNTHGDTQTTQILSNGESLELIKDPANQTDKYFYGWYMVDPFIISGTTDSNGIAGSYLYFTWPTTPNSVSFETPITIAESSENTGEYQWNINGTSGSGIVDDDGNIHVFLAPVFEKYNFVNFMLYPRNDSSSTTLNVMTRKMIALGSSTSVEVKISDIRSISKDSVHLIFIGWEYNDGTTDNPNWIQIQTVEYSGAEMKETGKDGVYLITDLDDKSSIDLYPIFIEARWVDYFSGVSGSGASFEASTFRESWGTPDNPPSGMEVSDKNTYSALPVPTRKGYTFEGWYAFAETDSETGEILNLNDAQDITINYIEGSDGNYSSHSVTKNTQAIRIANGDGSISYNGTYSFTDGGNTISLFKGENGKLKLFDAIDRLSLYANWTPDVSQITIVYWTEVAQLEGYTAPDNQKDDYTSSAAITITTEELNAQSSVIGASFTSESTITLEQLQRYTDQSIGVLDPLYLDEAGALLSGEEKFYELNEALSDSAVVLAGDGSTIFNVYYSRMEFTLVFHIGRDGYVKNSGNQKTDINWDGNWLEFMYKDEKVTALGYPKSGGGRNPGDSYKGSYSMTYLPENKTYTADYVTTQANVMGDYDPVANNDTGVYIITAKYSAYIGDKWPTRSNSNFSFSDDPNKGVTLYIWAAYYGSLYCRIANERSNYGNTNGNNPDINGVYSYMSAELCSNRTGDDIINSNHVHHLVAYYGQISNNNRFKQYHILYEAVEGTYDPDNVTLVSGADYIGYDKTTWCAANGDENDLVGHYFYELPDSPTEVISNLEPQFQLGWEFDGMAMIYSCYNPTRVPNTDPDKPGQKDYHIYYFYTPNQYNLTFMYEDKQESDTYYYTESLAGANKYDPPEKEGYDFIAWYTNSAGEGDPFDFANEKMPAESIILYPVFKQIQYIVKIDPNGAVIDRWREGSTSKGASTGFRANYKETIGAYNYLERNYIQTNSEEISEYHLTENQIYYYLNTQYISEEHDGDFIPTKLRNTLYLTAAEIDTYWAYYSAVPETEFTSRSATKFTDKDEWMDAYFGGHDLNSLPKYRALQGVEHYSSMGWYQVFSNGTVSSTPYNFNEPLTGDLELRALWRLDGGYYIQYNPYFFIDDGAGNVTVIVGELQQWMDPENPSIQLYADQSPTHILRAPINTTDGWVFRGWRVVKANGTSTYNDNGVTKTYTKWEPVEFVKDNEGHIVLDENNQPVVKYYQPGDNFTIDSALVSEIQSLGAVIHMQAYYQEEENSDRRPKVTNLILDSNDAYRGYVNTADSASLPALSLPGTEIINTTSELYNSHPTQILFGDFQSNLALHLYQYATSRTINGVTGTNFFTHEDSFLLLGFDTVADPTNPSTGEAYIPAFAADSVISVTRDQRITLYAMWEPKVYVNFINTTGENITITLGGAAGSDAVRIVNIVTGEYDRVTTNGTITVPAKSGEENGIITIVLPMANAGTDTFTASALNDHIHKEMSVVGEFRDDTPYGVAGNPVRYGGTLTYTGTLQTDAIGVNVIYSEIPINEVIYDKNGGTWMETSADYELRIGGQYALPQEKIVNNQYEPAEPKLTGKVFMGWTTNPDIAAQTDFSSETEVTWGNTTITPDEGSNVLAKVKSQFIWDFTQDPPYNETLYAVWSEPVTITFDLLKTGNTNHQWTGPSTVSESGSYRYYRQGNSRYVTYTLMKGDKLPRPEDPTNNDWLFLEWLAGNSNFINTPTGHAAIEPYVFDFDQAITERVVLYTSWINKNNFQVYTFTIQNEVVDAIDENDEFQYEITTDGIEIKTGSTNTYTTPDVQFGSITTKLKNNEQYTVKITVSREPSQSGTSHNYAGYDVYVEVYDRSGSLVKDAHLLTYQGEDDAREFKYIIKVSQADKAGYSTDVSADETGVNILTLNDGEFTFTSKNGGRYTPITNGFNSGTVNSTITFTNWRKADLTITKNVTNDLGDRERDFTFTLSSITGELTGVEYPYTKTRSGSTTGSGRITTADGNNTFTLKHNESITISLPPNKDIVITESNGYYDTVWTKNDGNDPNVTLTNGNTAAATINLTGDSAITVTNTRGTQEITVAKVVTTGDDSETFGFTASILDGTVPFEVLTVYGSTSTDSNGQVQFNLSHNGTQALTVPYGAKLVVTEAVSINYTPSAEMVDSSNEQVQDADIADGSFTVDSVTTDGTITFTNAPTLVRRVIFDVNEGSWTDSQYFDSLVENQKFTITEENIINNGNAYEPNVPTRDGKVFIGWTTNAALAAVTDFSGTAARTLGGQTFTPGTGEILLDKVRSEGLWDFTQDPPYGQTLYAVWSDAVTVTFDIVRDGSNLHRWDNDGSPTTDVPGTNVYYRSFDTSGTITYTLAKGERVPKPSDPTTDQAGWHFVQWLLNDTSRRNTTKNPSDPTIISNTYDFMQRIMDNNTTLSTSWTTTEPQMFTFTVENHVNCDPNEEFTYTIAVSNEKVFGKIGNKTTNTYGDPDQKWGSVTTTLKNNETYTVRIKVLNSTKWNPNTYSIQIDVIDREGNLIKSGHVVYCKNNSVSSDYSGKNYTSDYKYMLTITQDAKTGYETTVGVRDRNNVDSPVNYIANPPEGCEETSDSERKFTFTSIHGGTSAQASNFTPLTNEYTGNESNSLTVVFTNTKPGANLTVTKTVAGTDNTSDIFNFTAEVGGIADDTNYWWQKYATSDGTTYTSMTGTGSTGTGTLTSSANTVSFTLRHHQKIVIGGLPDDATVTVTENNGSYIASWLKDGEAIQPTGGEGTSEVTVTLAADTVLDVTNTKAQEETIVAPTGINIRHTPWLLLLMFGLVLLIGSMGVIKKKRRSIHPDDSQPDIVIRPANTGPPGSTIVIDSKARDVPCSKESMWGGDAG